MTSLYTSPVQTDSSLPPNMPAEFITYDEFLAMKQDKEEVELLLQESMNTIQLLKEKVRFPCFLSFNNLQR
jgi:hypothetical protein